MTREKREATMETQGAWWRWVLAGVGIPVLLIVILLILLAVIPPSRIEAERERLRSEGLPASLAELDAWAEAPAGVTNGAPEVTRLVERLGQIRHRVENRDAWGFMGGEIDLADITAGDWTRSEVKRELRTNAALREEFRRFMEQAGPVLDKLDRALEAEAFAYDLDYTAGAGMLLPHLSPMRKGTRFLALRAYLRALEGEPDAALRSVRKGLDLSATLEREPVFVSQLVRIRAERVPLGAIRDVLAVSRPGAGALRETADRVGEVRDLGAPILFWGVLGDYLRFLDFDLELLKRGRVPNVPMVLNWPPVARLMIADIIPYYRKVLTAAGGTLAEARPIIGGRLDIDREIASWNVLGRLLLPAADRALKSGFERQERLRLAELGLRLHADRLEGRPYPETGGEIDSPLAEDIFTEAPIRLHRTEDGWLVLQSVGLDQVDDWAELAPHLREGEYVDPSGGSRRPGDDILFAVPIPDAAPGADAETDREAGPETDGAVGAGDAEGGP